ncbi:ribosome-binding factor A [Candidatus Jorgensenbacteria bacterium]|nr:ribosome-binding factor A [Candidatus Jorgensenbacteria bacterium]
MRLYRKQKIGSVIQEQLAEMFTRDFDFEGTLVTIMDVEVSEDLLHALVKLGIIPYENGPEVFKDISGRRREIQHKLLKKMNIRPMPQVEFVIEEENKAT